MLLLAIWYLFYLNVEGVETGSQHRSCPKLGAIIAQASATMLGRFVIARRCNLIFNMTGLGFGVVIATRDKISQRSAWKYIDNSRQPQWSLQMREQVMSSPPVTKISPLLHVNPSVSFP